MCTIYLSTVLYTDHRSRNRKDKHINSLSWRERKKQGRLNNYPCHKVKLTLKFLKVHENENFLVADFGFLSKIIFPTDKWMFYREKKLLIQIFWRMLEWLPRILSMILSHYFLLDRWIYSAVNCLSGIHRIWYEKIFQQILILNTSGPSKSEIFWQKK